MPEKLQYIIGYKFSNLSLLETAMTHKSVTADKNIPDNQRNYERLEFLGDRVLNLVVADLLLQEFEDEAEGQIARRYSALINRHQLSEIALSLKIGEYIRLSEAENISGGQDKLTILADVVESIIGAIYRDGGLEPAQEFVSRLIKPLLNKNLEPPIDYKTALQEWLQARSNDIPTYTVTNQTGPDHAPEFEISVSVLDFPPQSASAKNKKAAEKGAAEKMLNWIKAQEK